MEPFYLLKANPRHLLQELSWHPAISNYIPIVQGPCLLPLPVPTYLQVKPIVDWEKNYIYFCGKKVVHTRTQISRKSTSLSKKRQYKHQTWCEWHWRCLEYNTSRDKNHISLTQSSCSHLNLSIFRVSYFNVLPFKDLWMGHFPLLSIYACQLKHSPKNLKSRVTILLELKSSLSRADSVNMDLEKSNTGRLWLIY